jgi:hypothetical protein
MWIKEKKKGRGYGFILKPFDNKALGVHSQSNDWQ